MTRTPLNELDGDAVIDLGALLTRSSEPPRIPLVRFPNLRLAHQKLDSALRTTSSTSLTMLANLDSRHAQLKHVNLPRLNRKQPEQVNLTKLLPVRTVTASVPGVEGSLTNNGQNLEVVDTGPVNIELAPNPPKMISVATLRALLSRQDVAVLRRVGSRWEVCSDDHLINLTDLSQRYRVGSVEVYS